MKLHKILGLGVVLAFFAGASSYGAELKVGLVLDKGGKDDKSFNSAAYQGAMKAKDDLKVFVKAVEATDDNSFEPMLRDFARRDFDLIIGIGFAQKEAMSKIAAQFPNKHFAIVDSEVPLANVRSLMFEEHEGSFLVGAIAAKTSKTGEVGFIGGMDIPMIRRFEMGFMAGAKRANPKVKIFSNYVGVTPDAWNNPAKAKELALSQYSQGADVIFAAAGASNGGLFDAAEEKKKFAIGVDSNQNWIKPGLVLTSMMKRVDVAVFETIQEAQKGTFAGGTKRFGLANQGVDFAVDQYNEKLLTADVRKSVDELKKEIIAGKIKVPDYYVEGAHAKKPKS
jgi:basic membrane protein A